MNSYNNILIIWCPEPESNRHGRLSPRDFKSLVSTNFTIRAVDLLDYSLDDVFLSHILGIKWGEMKQNLLHDILSMFRP